MMVSEMTSEMASDAGSSYAGCARSFPSDQALLKLIEEERVSYEEALRVASRPQRLPPDGAVARPR